MAATHATFGSHVVSKLAFSNTSRSGGDLNVSELGNGKTNEGFVLDSGYDLKAKLSHADQLASSDFMTKAKYSQCASACSRPRRNLDCPGILSLSPKNDI